MITNRIHFIIVDDNPINNLITKRIITKYSPQADMISFTEPEIGLDYVLSVLSKSDKNNSILLLDINMPDMTGWQFMERLEHESTLVGERLLIYILSSSIDAADIERARVNPHISDFIMKPLTHDAIISIHSMKAG